MVLKEVLEAGSREWQEKINLEGVLNLTFFLLDTWWGVSLAVLPETGGFELKAVFFN